MKLNQKNLPDVYPSIKKHLRKETAEAVEATLPIWDMYDDDEFRPSIDDVIDLVNKEIADLDDEKPKSKPVDVGLIWSIFANTYELEIDHKPVEGSKFKTIDELVVFIKKNYPEFMQREDVKGQLKNYGYKGTTKPAEKKEPKSKKAPKPKAKFKVGDKVVTDHNSELVCVVREKNLNANNCWVYILDGASGQWAEEQLQKAPKAKKVAKEDTAELVKQISTEVTLFKSYARLHGKKVTYRQLMSLNTALGKAIVSGAIDSPKYREMTATMHDKVGAALEKMKKTKTETVNVNVDNVDRYREIGASEKLFVGVTLLKRYINLANRIGMDKQEREKQRQNLLAAVNKALDGKKVESQYIDYVKSAKKNLEDKSIAPISLDLSGLAGIYGLAGEIADDILNGCDGSCTGLGSIVSATELAKIDFDTVRIPQEYRTMIGNASKNGSIMLYGMAGGGKTSFSINFAKKCAEMGQKVLIISKEEGINQTMQEKLKRFNAVNDNIFVTENIPASTKDYDVIIFDSVQSLGLEPSDLENHQHNLNALRVYIFQVTKDGRFRGANEFEHLVDCVLKAENGTITSKGCKNRFGGNGSVKVF